MPVKRTGDWKKAREAVSRQAAARFKRAQEMAVMQEALDIRKQIVQGIRNQAPGGQQFKPLSKITLLIRRMQGFGGRKALIRSATLIRSIVAKKVGGGKVFIGVLRGATAEGKTDVANIARVHEQGATFVMKLTPKARRWWFAMLHKAGEDVDVEGHNEGRFSTGSGGRAVLIVRIPARPFIGPVYVQILSNPPGLERRLAKRVSTILAGKLGKY